MTHNYERDGIHVCTNEPLTDDEQAALFGLITSMRPKPPAPHLPTCFGGIDPANADPNVNSGCAPDCPRSRQLDQQRSRRVTGRWTCSTSEEHWDCSEDFETEAEAIEYGQVYCEEMGVEDGRTYYTGQIVAEDPTRIAKHGSDAERVVEQLEEHLYETVGDQVDYEIKPTREQLADLDERLERATRYWLVHHDLAPHVFTIERMKSHRFDQCEERDTMKNDPDHHPRCIRHAGHPMDDEGHDFQDDRCDSPTCDGCRRRR